MTDAATLSPQGLRPEEVEAVQRLRTAWDSLRTEVGKVVIGQEEVVEQLLVCFFSGGHGLLVGVPGLAKTLLIRSLSEVLSLSFRRIQFTPDLMPSDITGTDILSFDPKPGERRFQFVCGPIFAHILLADEINRTPPKTQAALMEAMEEGQVTCGGSKYMLEKPFFVLATQNPIEQEGTYPLPAAQLDRFTFNIHVTYPDPETEFLVALRTTSNLQPRLRSLLGREDVLELLGIVRKVGLPDPCLRLAVTLVRASRPGNQEAPPFVRDYVEWGAGPRAVQCLLLCGKARAMLHGRFHVEPEDVLSVLAPVLRHRIIPNYHAEAEGVTTDDVVERIAAHVAGRPASGRATGLWARVRALLGR